MNRRKGGNETYFGGGFGNRGGALKAREKKGN